MKKMSWVAVLLSVCLLCGCSVLSTDKNESSVAASSKDSYVYIDAVSHAKKGEIVNCPFALGANPNDVLAKYNESDESEASNESTSSEGEILEGETESFELSVSGEDPIRLMTGDAKYYYHPAENENDNQISFIAYFDDAYSYFVGLSTPEEVLRTVEAKVSFDGDATADDLFFYFGTPESIRVIRYEWDGIVLSFYFENGTLSATTIYNTTLWNTSISD